MKVPGMTLGAIEGQSHNQRLGHMPRLSQDHGGRRVNSYTVNHAWEGGFYVTHGMQPAGEPIVPLICGDLETCLIYVAQKLTDPQPKKRTAK